MDLVLQETLLENGHLRDQLKIMGEQLMEVQSLTSARVTKYLSHLHSNTGSETTEVIVTSEEADLTSRSDHHRIGWWCTH